MKNLLAVIILLICNCVVIGQRPGVISYEEHKDGWCYASPETNDEDILKCFKITPQTIVYIDKKKVNGYPAKEQRSLYKIECFVPNKSELVAISIVTIKLKKQDFNIGGK